MRLMVWLYLWMLAGLQLDSQPGANILQTAHSITPALQHTVSLKVGDQTVFDVVQMPHANLSVYPNQLLFTIMDDEGQNLTITFAGKDISQRRPQVLTFKEPGLFHGYSETGDVFFLAFGRLDPEREPGQLKYDQSFPYHIMEGKLTVLKWTENEFAFEFEGKLGNDDEVDLPDRWLSFSGEMKANDYQIFTN